MEIPGIEAAMMVVERQDGAPAVVTRGMSPEESQRPPTSGVAGTLRGPSPSATATDEIARASTWISSGEAPSSR